MYNIKEINRGVNKINSRNWATTRREREREKAMLLATPTSEGDRQPTGVSCKQISNMLTSVELATVIL